MNNFRVALLQLMPDGADQERNRLKGMKFCRLAQEMNADVALFPEMWNIGYTFSPMTQASVNDILESGSSSSPTVGSESNWGTVSVHM